MFIIGGVPGKNYAENQLVTVKDGQALLDRDTLAGSVLKMKDTFKAVRNLQIVIEKAALY